MLRVDTDCVCRGVLVCVSVGVCAPGELANAACAMHMRGGQGRGYAGGTARAGQALSAPSNSAANADLLIYFCFTRLHVCLQFKTERFMES